jgi:hypothetical protein
MMTGVTIAAHAPQLSAPALSALKSTDAGNPT